MNPGKMDRRIALQSLTVTKSSSGAPQNTWTTQATVWAEFRQTKGTEVLEQAQERTKESGIFFIRYRSDVATTWRVQYAGRDWDIVAVREIGRREGLELTVEASR